MSMPMSVFKALNEGLRRFSEKRKLVVSFGKYIVFGIGDIDIPGVPKTMHLTLTLNSVAVTVVI